MTLLLICSGAGLILLPGCTDDSPPSGQAENCGGRGPCPDGYDCVGDRCLGNQDTCCGADCQACAAHERCEFWQCVCADVEGKASFDNVCGCGGPGDSPVDCTLGEHPEVCRKSGDDGQWLCECDPAAHAFDEQACGCPDRRPCPVGFMCIDGGCRCQAENNQENSSNCGCRGPCSEDRICSAGVCVCREGDVECGGFCLPQGTTCCNRRTGSACPPGQVCDRNGVSSVCRAVESRPCRDDDNNLLLACDASERCVERVDGSRDCVHESRTICYDDQGRMTHQCDTDDTCLSDGRCLAPGQSECGDGRTICDAGFECEPVERGWQCRPEEVVSCHRDGLFVGFCQQEESCVFGALGRWMGCVPEDWLPCYDAEQVFTHACPPHLRCGAQLRAGVERPFAGCVLPDEQVCDDGVTVCAAGETCERAADSWVCRPPGTTPCYERESGLYIGRCDADEACESTPDGIACRPETMTPCYTAAGDYSRYCRPGEKCTLDAQRCIPADSSECPDGEVCPQGQSCRQAPDRSYLCQPDGTVGCYSSGAYVGACPPGQVCEVRDGAGIRPGRVPYICRPSDVVACYANGFYQGFCAQGEVCRPNGGCARPTDTICADGRVCPAGEVCVDTGGNRWQCRPADSRPCFNDNGFDRDISHWCDAGQACELSRNGWACRPEEQTPCYDRNGYYRRSCNAGWTCGPDGNSCIAPDHTLCGNNSTVCGPGEVCQRTSGGGYACRPEGTTPCYRWSSYTGYEGFCQADSQCLIVRGGYRCMPRGEGFSVCYERTDTGWAVSHWCPPSTRCANGDWALDGDYCYLE